jgi:hypothetical protein
MAFNAKDQKQIDSQTGAHYILHKSKSLREYSEDLEYDAQRVTFKPKTSSQYVFDLLRSGETY